MNDLFIKIDYLLYFNVMIFVCRLYVKNLVSVDVDVVVLGVLLDMVMLGCFGVCMGFDVICRVLVNLVWEGKKFLWDFNFFNDIKVIDVGDLVFDCGDVEDFMYWLEVVIGEILKSGKIMLVLGGDYFIILLILWVYVKYYGEMVLIYFDVYIDIYVNGSVYDYGIMFYYVLKEGLILVKYLI